MSLGQLVDQYFLGEIKSIDELCDKFNQELYIEITKGVAMNIDINLIKVREFVESEKFTTFLTSNTTDFGTAAFILQTVLDELDRAEKPGNETYYKIRRADLLDLLEDVAKMAVLRADGVDNWEWYMEGRTDCFKEWYGVSEEEACEMSFEDAAKLDIQQYERV